jgi:ATP-dependent Clp protease ATP-binding subunit ClpC
MSMWEPFTVTSRHAIVRAQQVAQLFGSSHIGVEHITFALAEGDDEVGRLFATSIDRDAIRERLGAAGAMPNPNMVFTAGAKRTIELAFENARRLNHNYIGQAHIALGLLGSDDPPPLVEGTDLATLRAELARVAANDEAV